MKINLKYQPIPENAPLFAVDIVEAAKEVSGVHLDYSPESVKDVDKIIESLRSGGSKKEDVSATLFGFGCYIGEIFIKNHGGIWKASEATPMKEVTSMPFLIEMPDGQVGNPIGKAFKQFDSGQFESVYDFYQVFSKPYASSI
jgi:hypothetical protein